MKLFNFSNKHCLLVLLVLVFFLQGHHSLKKIKIVNNTGTNKNDPSSQSKQTASTVHGDVKPEDALSLGWSVFSQNEDYTKDPVKLLTKNRIFNYKIDFATKNFNSLIVSTSPYFFTINKNYTWINHKELKDLNSHTVLGGYIITNNSTTHYNEANLFIENEKRQAHLKTDTYQILELSHDHNNNFPALNKNFYEEVYKTFYDNPVKQSFSKHFNYKSLEENSAIFIPMLQFFKKYGTHYVNRAYYGFRTGSRNYRESEKSAGDAQNMKDFTIGNCKVVNRTLVEGSCDINNPLLVKFEVQPISDLFSTLSQSSKDINNILGKPVDEPTLKKIHQTMQTAIEMIQQVTKIDNLAVSNFEAASLDLKNPGSPCFKEDLRIEIIENNFKNYTSFNDKRNLVRQIKYVNRDRPVSIIKNYGRTQKYMASATDKEKGLFSCAKKSFIFPLTSESDLLKMNNQFYTDIKFIGDNDRETYQQAGYTCKKTWYFTDPKHKNEKIDYHFCTTTTKNPFNPNIITDVKFFEFEPNTYKCSDRVLRTYIEHFYYDCDCDLDISLISDRPKQGDTFFCKARNHQGLARISEEINQPKVKFRRVKWRLPKEIEEEKSKMRELDNLGKGSTEQVKPGEKSKNEKIDDESIDN